MSESNETSAPTNEGTPAAEAAPPAAEAPKAAEAAPRGPSLVTKLKTHPKLQQAITVAKAHPLGAVVGVAAAAAFVEVELAVGILTGIGATALLASKSGPQTREQVVTAGKQALARAKEQVQKHRKPAAPANTATPTAA
jgi:hypothetical protein